MTDEGRSETGGAGRAAGGAAGPGAGADAGAEDAPGTDRERSAQQGAPEVRDELAERILEALREVKDPELGLNIVDLGLVYDVELEDGSARVTMTLTSPGCPAGGQILSGAQERAGSVEGVDGATVNLVWKPFWTPDRIDPKVRAALGY
ncbi:MAG TPA: metal-sulfur cluster assembly factor [Gemmatimonadota bacterium]|nr:metal-sulfur cluster assembly factor [Gemmatimonadota bacterium]